MPTSKAKNPFAIQTAIGRRIGALKLLYVLSLTSLISVWLSQNSINSYWQQTYHQDSPIAGLSHNRLWALGGRLEAGISTSYQRLTGRIAAIDSRIEQQNDSQTAALPSEDSALDASLNALPEISAPEPAAQEAPAETGIAQAEPQQQHADAETAAPPAPADSTEPAKTSLFGNIGARDLTAGQPAPAAVPAVIPLPQTAANPVPSPSQIGARDLTAGQPAPAAVPAVIPLPQTAANPVPSPSQIGARDLTRLPADQRPALAAAPPPAALRTPAAPETAPKTEPKPAAETTKPAEPPAAKTAAAPQPAGTLQSETTTLRAGDKVFFAGDSLMQGVAPWVQKYLKKQYNISSINLSKQSTGLSYPNFFDWPQTIEDTLKNDSKIKLLVIFLGPNDPWDFPNPSGQGYLKFKSPEWEAEYRRRAERILTAAEAHNVRILWLGLPFMKAKKLNSQMLYLDRILRDTVRGRGIYLSTKYNLTGGASEYTDPVKLSGKTIYMRTKDGVHFSIAGQKLLAALIERRIAYQPD